MPGLYDKDEAGFLGKVALSPGNVPDAPTWRAFEEGNAKERGLLETFAAALVVAHELSPLTEWTTAVAVHLETPVPTLKILLGETTLNNPNIPFISVDHHGHNLTIAGVMGGGTQRNHNAILQAISKDFCGAGIKNKGGGKYTNVKKQSFGVRFRAPPTFR